MPRRKWVPYSEFTMLNSRKRAPSLWWWGNNDDDPSTRKRREQVIAAYLRQVARGRTVDQKQLKKDLLRWIEELAWPLDGRYWMLSAFAKEHDPHPHTLMKRFREMENIAKRLFPERVPRGRKPQPLTEELKRRIGRRYLQLKLRIHDKGFLPRELWFADDDIEFTEDVKAIRRYRQKVETFRHKGAIAKLIKRFPEIPPFRLGQICREVRRAKRFPRLRFPREF